MSAVNKGCPKEGQPHVKTRTEGCILLHLRRCLEKDILLRRQPLPISVPFSGLSPTRYIFSKLRKVPISFLRQLSKEDTEIEGYSDSVTPFRICNKSGKISGDSHTCERVLGREKRLQEKDCFITINHKKVKKIKLKCQKLWSHHVFILELTKVLGSDSPPSQDIFTFPSTTTNSDSEGGFLQRQHSSMQGFKTETFIVDLKSGNLQ